MIQDFLPNKEPESQEPNLSEFAQGVLKDIPEEDRATVSKYLSTWDGNVTKKFQEHAEKLKPYEELGDFEDLKASKYYLSLMQDDPETYVKTILQAYKEAGIEVSLDDFFEVDDENENQPPPIGGIPPEFQRMIDEQRTMIENLHGELEGFKSQQSESQAMEQLDKMLKGMHDTHGEFDDEWVLLQIEKGLDPDKAIEAWQEKIIKKFSSPSKPAPKIMSGTGAVKVDQVDPTKLNATQRQHMLAEAIRASRG